MTNPLGPIFAWYSTTLDCQRITFRVLEEEIRQAVTPKHEFYGQPIDASMARVEAAKQDLGDLAVLSLVSTFERTIRDHLARLPRHTAVGASPLEEAVRVEFLKDLEYWRLSDRVLVVFGSYLPANLIGQVKQIIEYRNWVAHGRSPSKPPSSNVAPQYAYQALSEFLKRSGIT